MEAVVRLERLHVALVGIIAWADLEGVQGVATPPES